MFFFLLSCLTLRPNAAESTADHERTPPNVAITLANTYVYVEKQGDFRYNKTIFLKGDQNMKPNDKHQKFSTPEPSTTQQ